VPCGAVAGVIARLDARRGVWAAPAGPAATIRGVNGLEIALNDVENQTLNAAAINCLRTFPDRGSVVWGARTMRGADPLGDPFKYVPLRRLALHIEESLTRGLQWAVFEPNNATLWSEMRQRVADFLDDLFRQGAFQGASAKEAYFVRCDATTTTSGDSERGIVNLMVGFAPLKPAEFVVLQLALPAGQARP
jgi:phage tail sheath protein FI